MKNKVSELMDGELDDVGIADTITHINKKEDLRNDWNIYHLIGDTLRHSSSVSIDITSQVSKRLDKEPTVLTPHPPTEQKVKVFAFSVAASMVTAVAAVVWMSAQTTDRPLVESITNKSALQAAAKVDSPVISASIPTLAQETIADKSVPQTAVQAEPTIVSAPLSTTAQINDYFLLVHGEFSPRAVMRGVSPPYIHQVAESDKRVAK
jgi:sigma-E factor negative regulatory protein RseA